MCSQWRRKTFKSLTAFRELSPRVGSRGVEQPIAHRSRAFWSHERFVHERGERFREFGGIEAFSGYVQGRLERKATDEDGQAPQNQLLSLRTAGCSSSPAWR